MENDNKELKEETKGQNINEINKTYELCSFSINFIYELLLNFNGSMENSVIL